MTRQSMRLDCLLMPDGLMYTRRDNVQYWRRPGKDDGFSATFVVFQYVLYFSDDETYYHFHLKEGTALRYTC